MANLFQTKLAHTLEYARSVGKHLLFALMTGVVGGLIGTAFHLSLEHTNTFFRHHTWLIWLLPIGGVVIVFLYKLTHMTSSEGTDDVIDSVRSGKHLRFMMSPLIFISTLITHALGGSSGREGAALQLGGSISATIGRLFSLDQKDMHTVTLCGMSALFSALFCTPLTAVFFAVEVISVGIMYYVALLPCLAASLIAFGIALLCGSKPLTFSTPIPAFSFDDLWRTAILAIGCAIVSIVFCIAMRETKKWAGKMVRNPFLRIVIGAAIIIALTFLCGNYDYNGAGMHVVTRAVETGVADPAAFIWKLVFTAITIGCGFKGGEIVPTMFIGATFGCAVGPLMGLPAELSAALGLVGVFCGAVNCPVTSIILSVELFGAQGLLLFAVTCVISYILSGNFGLYHSQKIVYSKLRMEWINQHAK